MVSSHGLVSRSSHFVNNTEYQVFIGGIPSNATDEDIEKSITVFGRVIFISIFLCAACELFLLITLVSG